MIHDSEYDMHIGCPDFVMPQLKGQLEAKPKC